MTITVSTELRGVRNSATLTLIDAGGSGKPGYAAIFNSAGTLLVTVPFAQPMGAVGSDGRIVLAAGETAMASGDGIPASAQVFNGLGSLMFSCSASLPGSGGDIQVAVSGGDGTKIYAGGLVQFTGGTLG